MRNLRKKIFGFDNQPVVAGQGSGTGMIASDRTTKLFARAAIIMAVFMAFVVFTTDGNFTPCASAASTICNVADNHTFDAGVSVNDDGGALATDDFRVETDTKDNAIDTDATDDTVAFGKDAAGLNRDVEFAGTVEIDGTLYYVASNGNVVHAGDFAATDLDGIVGSNVATLGTFTTLAATTINASGDVNTSAGTFNPLGDVASGDTASVGYTVVEGLILTGQGSSYDVTVKNDADQDVWRVPTGTQGTDFQGNIAVQAGGKILFDGIGGHTNIEETGDGLLDFTIDNQVMLRISDTADALQVIGAELALDSGRELSFNAGNNTHIVAESTNELHVVVNGITFWEIDQNLDALCWCGTGQSPDGHVHRIWRHNFTSDGGAANAVMDVYLGILTAAVGDTDYIAFAHYNPQITTQTSTSNRIAFVSSLLIDEPNIDASGLTSTAGIDVAAALVIQNVPTEGDVNAAIYSAIGDNYFIGDVRVGHDSEGVQSFGGALTMGSAGSATVAVIGNFQNGSNSGVLQFLKSRDGAIADGTEVIVQDNDLLGKVEWKADDGTDFNTVAAAIQVYVDGVPGANDMPARMEFYTTPDGSNAIVERLEINEAGNFDFNNGDLNNLGDAGTDFTSTQADIGVPIVGADDLAIEGDSFLFGGSGEYRSEQIYKTITGLTDNPGTPEVLITFEVAHVSSNQTEGVYTSMILSVNTFAGFTTSNASDSTILHILVRNHNNTGTNELEVDISVDSERS